jgi:hypothetical protein
VHNAGPGFLPEITSDIPDDFQPYETFKSSDGSETEAIGTQEELLIWMNSDSKGDVWQAKHDVTNALSAHMALKRQTPTFILGDSMDMTGNV